MIDSMGQVQSVLLVGGTSDIGLAIARRLLQARGRRLVLAGRDRVALQRAHDGVRSVDQRLNVEVELLDMTDIGSHQAVLDDVFDRGDIDVVVVAAGVLGDQAGMEADPDGAVAVAETNYVGPLSVIMRAAKRLDDQGHGAIVLLSSVAGLRGRRSNYVYGSTKAGIDVACRGLAARLADRGVRVITVRPGFVRTRMTAGLAAAPLAVEADDVADAVERAVRTGRDMVYVPAAMRWVMLGLRALPERVFRRLDL